MSEPTETYQLISSSEAFGIYGILLGAFLTTFTFWFLNRQRYRLALWEKIVDRRILAHEDVVHAAKLLQSVSSLGGVGVDGELRRIPTALVSIDEFTNYHFRVAQLTQANSGWLSIEVIREINFVQDYLINVSEYIKDLDDYELEDFAIIVRLDFTNMGGKLEKKAFKIFERDVMKLKIGDVRKWHKYKRDITERRLFETDLFKKVINKETE